MFLRKSLLFTVVLVTWLACGLQHALTESTSGVTRVSKVTTVATFDPAQC
jgi:hypothetical protein